MADLGHGWLMAICGLPTNPVYEYLCRIRLSPQQAWRKQRLRVLLAFTLPALVLSWFGAEFSFLWLDPRLHGIDRCIAELQLLCAGLQYSADGLGTVMWFTLAPGCAIWFAIRTCRWTLNCTQVLAAPRSHHSPLVQEVLESTPVDVRGLIVAVLAAELRAWLPLIVVGAVAYTVFTTLLQFNDSYDLFHNGWSHLAAEPVKLVSRIVITAISFNLPLLFNSLMLVSLGRGDSGKVAAPIAAAGMLLAQGSAAMQMPFISDDLTFGFGLNESAPFWLWFTAAWFAYAAAVTGLLALAQRAAACRAACLIVWPLLLLTAIVLPAWLAGYGLDLLSLSSGWYGSPQVLIPPLICGAGALVNPCVMPVTGSWQEYLSSQGKSNPLPILVLVAALTQLGLIALSAVFAVRATDSRKRGEI